jgi:IMP dehydrogenase/GMP reductase
MDKRKFDFDDITIVPKKISEINSRYNDITITYENGNLPLFTAPMDSVVDINNMYEFDDCGINVVLPRTSKKETEYGKPLRPHFVSLGINEFEKMVETKSYKHHKHILIDVANGHMKKISDLVNKAMELIPSLRIMVGNIANPETYRYYAENTKVRYIRVGIGNGNGCLTTQQTGVGYPKAALINECYRIKQELGGGNELPYIVADGGMKDYSDIIKSLALGADYVMVGSIFNKAIESSGQNYLYKIKISPKLAEDLFDRGFPVTKQFYGMSTKIAQKKMGKINLKTSEGVVRYRKVEYKLSDWVENFEAYLRSTMSYSDARTLNDFVGKADFEFISEQAFRRFNK